LFGGVPVLAQSPLALSGHWQGKIRLCGPGRGGKTTCDRVPTTVRDYFIQDFGPPGVVLARRGHDGTPDVFSTFECIVDKRSVAGGAGLVACKACAPISPTFDRVEAFSGVVTGGSRMAYRFILGTQAAGVSDDGFIFTEMGTLKRIGPL